MTAAFSASSDANGDSRDSVLLTTSCTTGWADWVHGELWLCPDGLLRIRLGWAATIDKSLGPGPAAAYEIAARQSSLRHFDVAEIDSLVARNGGNIWVPWTQISGASLRRGIITGRLRLRLANGKSVKFLWMRERRVFESLSQRLLERVGSASLR